jgi:hypothetical protein
MIGTLPDGFPWLESQSRKQMKDVELAANLLMYFEEGVRGYSQDELDQAFSDRDTEWEGRDDAERRFIQTVECLSVLVINPDESPVFKARMRNQADFYSLFTATAELIERGSITGSDPGPSSRLAAFVGTVEDEDRRRSANRCCGQMHLASITRDVVRALEISSSSKFSRVSQRNCPHQIVRTALERRISRSAVSKDSPSTNAVAPIMRSAGSRG